MRVTARCLSMDRSYKNAVEILHSRRRLRRPSAEPTKGISGSSSIPDGREKADVRGTPSIVGMKQWLQQIGHAPADIDRLNVIHVAGTKGKGSTCAWAESFLRAFGQRTGFPRKTGLYTSPHLILPEERIRISFQPIARHLFVKYFFEAWEALSQSDDGSQNLPRYLQLCALVSMHAFIREGVEAAIFETHHGGEYDATNVIENPVSAIVTQLGFDHIEQLGPGIENIAWHKAGIFKPGCHAFTPPQEPSAAKMLRQRAVEKDIKLEFVADDASLPTNAQQLKPDVQRRNCAVALAAVRSFVERKAPKHLGPLATPDVLQGVEQFTWPGRFQLIDEGAYQWYLDGAHNEMSVNKAAEWYIETSQETNTQPTRILIFGQQSIQRDSTTVVEHLADALQPVHMQHVIFTLYDPRQTFEVAIDMTPTPATAAHETFGEIWRRSHPQSQIHYESNVQNALDCARKIGAQDGGMHALITGSQHLIGGALFHLNSSTVGQQSP